MRPTVSRIVHYVSYGTPGGEYPPACRAAIVTEVGQWVTMDTRDDGIFVHAGNRAVRTLTQHFYEDALALTVLNPTGLFFNGAGPVACLHDETDHKGGTWHWPERDDAPMTPSVAQQAREADTVAGK